MAPAFEGIFVPNITPFAGGELDVPGLERVLRYLIDRGVDGVVPTGTTGETATLTDGEKRTVWEVSVAAAGRVEEARAIHYRLLPLIRLLFAESNPSPVKGVYELLHLCSRETRSPLVPATEARVGKLQEAIDRLGVAPVGRP